MSALSTYLRWSESYKITPEATIMVTDIDNSLKEVKGIIEPVFENDSDHFDHKVKIVPYKEYNFPPQEFYTSDLNMLIQEKPDLFKVSGFSAEVQEKITDALVYGYENKGNNHNMFFNGTPEYDAFEESAKAARENEVYLKQNKENSLNLD